MRDRWGGSDVDTGAPSWYEYTDGEDDRTRCRICGDLYAPDTMVERLGKPLCSDCGADYDRDPEPEMLR